MTKEQRELCWDLVRGLDGRSRITREEFLRRFPSTLENGKLAPKWLEEACQTKNAEDLDCVFIIGFPFGFARESLKIFRELIGVDWHHSHEMIVDYLRAWPTADTVDVLYCATQWIPKSLEYDDCRALAVKAIWQLGRIPGPESLSKLEELGRSDDAILRKNAENQLARRHRAS